MSDYAKWALRNPQAAAELTVVLNRAQDHTQRTGKADGSEAAAQQQVRFSVARQGAASWRNNVGATPTKCPDCGVKRPPVRYGLANESTKLNEQIKSHDLILAIPRLITPTMVGSTIAQFGSVEAKPEGWHYTGEGREAGQAAWGALIVSLGGYATFSTGEVRL